MYRHISKGAWTFSMQDQGWQVSDCTAEGLKVMPTLIRLWFILTLPRFISKEKYWILAKPTIFQVALLFSQMSQDLVGKKMETDRFYDAVNVILSLQVRIQPCKFFYLLLLINLHVVQVVCELYYPLHLFNFIRLNDPEMHHFNNWLSFNTNTE